MIPPGAFPLLDADNHRLTSPTSREYNCIGWAAGDTAAWWWPDAEEVGYWPAGVPRKETLAAFIQAFESLGYEPCNGAEVEEGFEKIAIYTRGGTPTHAARQLPTGRWSSKLGIQEDIEHELGALNGPAYGTVVAVLRRQQT